MLKFTGYSSVSSVVVSWLMLGYIYFSYLIRISYVFQPMRWRILCNVNLITSTSWCLHSERLLSPRMYRWCAVVSLDLVIIAVASFSSKSFVFFCFVLPQSCEIRVIKGVSLFSFFLSTFWHKENVDYQEQITMKPLSVYFWRECNERKHKCGGNKQLLGSHKGGHHQQWTLLTWQ